MISIKKINFKAKSKTIKKKTTEFMKKLQNNIIK